MQIKKVLVRKDAYSLILGVLLALVTSTLVSQLGMNISNKLIGNESGGDFSFMPEATTKQLYVMPVVAFIVSVLIIEIFLQLVAALKQDARPKKGKK